MIWAQTVVVGCIPLRQPGVLLHCRPLGLQTRMHDACRDRPLVHKETGEQHCIRMSPSWLPHLCVNVEDSPADAWTRQMSLSIRY